MQKESGRKVKTFTVGFSEHGYNEAVFAKAVAKHLKTEHTELYVSSDDAINVIHNYLNFMMNHFQILPRFQHFLSQN